MISWKTLRTVCLVLLLIPVIHLVYLVSRDTVATLDSSPDAWAAEIDAYARKDRASKLPKNPIVVVRQVPATEDKKAYTKTHVSFQSMGATNISGVNNLPSAGLYVTKR